MLAKPVISLKEAQGLMSTAFSRVCWVDCRFDLMDTSASEREYRVTHLPGAVYAHLDRDLSRSVVPGLTGRHPLPEPENFAATLRGWGVCGDTHVIAYDSGQGPYASRLWWMLHWIGHSQQSVLDGGFVQWKGQGLPLSESVPNPALGNFESKVNWDLVVSADDVESSLDQDGLTLVDCRPAFRHAGHSDPMDQPSGRIPGSFNQPHGDNLNRKGFFLPKEKLHDKLIKAYSTIEPRKTVTYCGSGVSSCHTILASAHAGLGFPRNYIDSWSHWITDPRRPIERDGDS